MYINNCNCNCKWIFCHLVATSRINISKSSSEKLTNVDELFYQSKRSRKCWITINCSVHNFSSETKLVNNGNKVNIAKIVDSQWLWTQSLCSFSCRNSYILSAFLQRIVNLLK